MAYQDDEARQRAAAQVTQPVPGVQRQGNSYTATTIADRARQPGYAFAAGTYTPKPAATAAAPSAQPVAAAPVTTQPTAQPAQSPKPAQSIAARVAPQAGGASGSWEAKQNPAKPTMPTDVRGWRTKAVIDGAAEDAQAAWDRGSPMAAAGSVIRGAVTAVPTAFMDAGRDVVDVVSGPVGNFYDGLTGNTSAPASAKVAAAQPVAPKTVAPTSAAPATSPATTQPKPGASTPEAGKPSATGSAASAGGKEIMPGVYRQGNSYGDSPEAAATGARPSQGPSTQNQSIAAALAQRSGQRPDQPADVMGIYARASEALKGVAEAQRALDDYGPRMSGGVTANDYLTGPASAAKFQQAMYRTALEKQAGQGGRGGAAAMQALNNMEGNQIQRDIALMREQGDTARFNAREAGETNRAGMRNTADARRDSIAAELGRGQLDLQRNAQGFTTRQAERQEKLYADYDAAKTPEDRATIAQKIRDLSGKVSDPKDNFMVVGGGQEWDEKAGAMRNVPQRLIDLRTGKEVGTPASQAPEAGKFEKGKTYTDANGNRATWDGTKFNPI